MTTRQTSKQTTTATKTKAQKPHHQPGEPRDSRCSSSMKTYTAPRMTSEPPSTDEDAAHAQPRRPQQMNPQRMAAPYSSPDDHTPLPQMTR